MANPNRRMCTLRRVSKVEPIKGADRIEAYHVDGWVVVDGKGAHREGDYVLYYEIDTFLPTNDPRYAAFAERGEKSMTVTKGRKTKTAIGHVLKTIRLRGVYSQGLIMDPKDIVPDIPETEYERICDNRCGLDKAAGVWEYHPDQNSLAAGFISNYDAFVAPRADAERVQNVSQKAFDLICKSEYFVSAKVDGTSITMVNDPRHNRVRAFSHNNEFDVEQGQGKTVMVTAERQGILSWLEENPGITLQMELCGPRIQSNPLGLKDHRLFVFSAWDMDERHYLNPYDMPEIRESCTPLIDVDLSEIGSPSAMVEWANGLRGNVAKDRLDEGAVVHVMGRGNLTDDEWTYLYNTLGSTMQMKAVSNRFLAKARE